MYRIVSALTVVAIFCASNSTFAGVTGSYNPITGQITVDVDNVVNWYIEHVGFASMTGDTPSGFNPAFGLITDNDVRIGQSGFASMSYNQLNLGNVAATQLSNIEELKVFWNDTLGSPLKDARLVYEEPVEWFITAVVNSNRPTAWNAHVDPTITFDTVGTTGESPLSYEWDFNYDGSFDPVAGYNTSSVTVSDVYSTVGPNGSYTAAVRISNFGDSDIATINYEYVPEPASFVFVVLAFLALLIVRPVQRSS